MKPTNER